MFFFCSTFLRCAVQIDGKTEEENIFLQQIKTTAGNDGRRDDEQTQYLKGQNPI